MTLHVILWLDHNGENPSYIQSYCSYEQAAEEWRDLKIKYPDTNLIIKEYAPV